LKSLIIIIPILISVSLLTLIERKILGYSQLRKGPNITGLYGLLQPLADGIKLFTKEPIIPNHVNIFLFIIAPIISFILSIIVWGFLIFNDQSFLIENNLSLLLILAINSIGIYPIIMAGWGSNSKYSFLGAIRATSQMISYEVSFGILLMCIIILTNSVNIINIYYISKIFFFFIFPLLPVSFLFFVSIVAETNRAPFDISEGESELVSGFNIEYSGFIFALFFLAEYSHIIFSSFIFSLLFLNYSINIFIKTIVINFIIIWIRSSFPRFRYDQLMHLLWKSYLPSSIIFIIIIPIIYILL